MSTEQYSVRCASEADLKLYVKCIYFTGDVTNSVSGDVGNPVCPARFDLGEQAKTAIRSVTEGEDKLLKYPHMFRASSIMIINKIDLLPYVDFDVRKAIKNALAVKPNITSYRLSARSGEEIDPR
jgi:hydrogenase nickel incorporation protein HypB